MKLWVGILTLLTVANLVISLRPSEPGLAESPWSGGIRAGTFELTEPLRLRFVSDSGRHVTVVEFSAGGVVVWSQDATKELKEGYARNLLHLSPLGIQQFGSRKLDVNTGWMTGGNYVWLTSGALHMTAAEGSAFLSMTDGGASLELR
ncbi:MAG: hypothetical protein AAGD14_05550, partial [Planctomycetota bacterium]